MNWIDITLIGIVGYNALIGFKRGLIRLIMDMVAFFLSIWISSHYGPILAQWLEESMKQTPPTSTIIGYIGVWLALFGVLSLIGMGLSRMLPVIGLGIADRLGGIIFGTVKGLLFCVPIIMPIQFFKPEMLTQSIMAPPLAPLVSSVGAHMFSTSHDH
ncbi:CvpA family protein [bacterium]|nr:CvpA family protein [bacterium]